MNVFFDTEFTGLQKDTELISIGLVSSDGKKFYGEIIDFSRDNVNEWIKENVIAHLWASTKTIDECANCDYYHIGTKAQIANELREWLSQFDDIQLISDVCHYDMMLFIDLFGGAFDLPDNISPVCHDINQDIARFFKVTQKEAFDMSRECIVGVCDGGNKHNALYDAEIIKKIYSLIKE